jgi:hypothetical protein
VLRELISDLRRLPPLERTETQMATTLTLAAGAVSVPRLPPRAGGYTRTCAYSDARFEVLLLDWSAGSVSEIHDHGGRHCWFVVLQGSLRVDDFERVDGCDVPGRAVLAARSSRSLTIGGLDLRSGAYDIHRVAAYGHAVTLHVYARPLREFLVYDERASSCRLAHAVYDHSLRLFSAIAS